jgi:hypothetical protein
MKHIQRTELSTEVLKCKHVLSDCFVEVDDVGSGYPPVVRFWGLPFAGRLLLSKKTVIVECVLCLGRLYPLAGDQKDVAAHIASEGGGANGHA